MPNIYIAENVVKDSIGLPVPDVSGLNNWRWLAEAPYFYFQSDIELEGVEVAPETYPNGVPVFDDDCIAEWRNSNG